MKFSNSSSLRTKLFAVLTALSLMTGIFASPLWVVEAGQPTYPNDPSVDICHATSADTNPYGPNPQTVNASSIVTGPNGHDTHTGPVFDGVVSSWGDIIPPFDYDLGDGPQHYSGLNWDTAGQAIWNNGCQPVDNGSDTVSFTITKAFDGDSQSYSASDFSFRVTGGETNDVFPHGSDIDVTEGTYTIEEIVPNDFVKEDWEVTWSGDCVVDDSDQYYSDFEVTADDVDAGTSFSCEATNKYVGNNGGGDEETVTVNLEKILGGAAPLGYTADQFSFNVTGGSIDQTVLLTPYTDTIARGSIELPIGEYNIEEVGPNDFVQGEWRPSWYGFGDEEDGGCAGDTFDIDIVIDEERLEDETLDCQVDNQWRYGTLRVVKEFVGTSSDPENFEFKVTQSEVVKFEGAFESDGDNTVTVGEGTYSVEETVFGNYEPSYSDGCSGNMEFQSSATCVITNTWTEDDNNGGGGGDDPVPGCTDNDALNFEAEANEDDGSCIYDNGGGGEGTYLIEGYVWHDLNENDEIDDGEDYLEDWILSITNGEDTATTSSDENGHYTFWVPAGTWTLSEMVEEGWAQVYPTPTSYEIEVPSDLLTMESSIGFPWTLFGQVAHAQVPVGGPFNFGNVFALACNLSISQNSVASGATVTLTWETWNANSVVIDNGIGTTTATGSVDKVVTTNTTYTLTATDQNGQVTCDQSVTILGGGGTNNPGPTGGGGERISLSDGGGGGSSSGSDSDDADGSGPIPQVLGEQVSVVPAGAPNAGAGGAYHEPEDTWFTRILSWFGLSWSSV